MMEDKLTDNTIIDAGHYSYLLGPTELDLHLWEEGVKLYAHSKEIYKNIGLMLLIDDMKRVRSNEQRRTFRIEELPKSYSSILEQYGVDRQEVQVVSQDRMKEKGKQLLRKQEMSRFYPQCRLIVGTTVRYKEKNGYTNSINFYDEEKTAKGINLKFGTVFSRAFLKTTIESHYLVFKDKNNYRYMHFNSLSEKHKC